MKHSNVLQFKLAKIKGDELTMTVKMRRTSHKYWEFRLLCGRNIDYADQIFDRFCALAGFEKLLNIYLNRIPFDARLAPSTWSWGALFCRGEHFPSRTAIKRFFQKVFVPCWQYAIFRITTCGAPDDSWRMMVYKAEKKYLFPDDDDPEPEEEPHGMENNPRSADV